MIFFKYCLYLFLFEILSGTVFAQTASSFAYPQSVFVDSHNGNIWVTDFDNNRVLRFDVSGLSAVNEHEPSPQDFYLGQNYPNPFNSSTRIEISTKISGIAKLIVYNSLGQSIKVLFEGNLKAGSPHYVDFYSKELPSGIYIYSFQTEHGREVKKMCLLK